MNENAVKDAIINAKLNNIENIQFIAGKAEKTMDKVLKNEKMEKCFCKKKYF
jgi:tRNA/tmRNA/rRNA uracil-C5-methylase (TrmA/RlmC/RlmD family)